MTGPSGALLDLAYGYDAAGNLTSRTDQAAGGRRTAAFGYDHLGRLTWAQHGSATRRYDLDPIGNLTRILVDEGQPSQGEVVFTYEPNPVGASSPVMTGQEMRQGGAPVASFSMITDPAGNVTSDGLAVYDYGVRNTLAERRLGAATTVHTMGADGLRARSRRLDTGAVTDVVLGPRLERLSRIRAGSVRDYVFLGGELIAYFDDAASQPVQVITDHIGFPLQAIDAQGAVRWDALSEVSGELREPFSRAFDPGLRYPGQWQDEVELEAACSGDTCTPHGPLTASPSLYENGHRWYRPQWGRYTQADPVGLSGSLSLFPYANQNPLSFADPLGLTCECRTCPSGYWYQFGGTVSGMYRVVGVGGGLYRFRCPSGGLQCDYFVLCGKFGAGLFGGIVGGGGITLFAYCPEELDGWSFTFDIDIPQGSLNIGPGKSETLGGAAEGGVQAGAGAAAIDVCHAWRLSCGTYS